MNTTLALLFITYSNTFGLPQGLLSSLCFVESSHKIEAVHYADGGSNSVGVCQIKLSTAQWLGFKGTEKQLMKPENNIYYAAKYLAHQNKRYNNIEKAVIAYNQGSAKTANRTSYSKKVMNKWKETKYKEYAINERTIRR